MAEQESDIARIGRKEDTYFRNRMGYRSCKGQPSYRLQA